MIASCACVWQASYLLNKYRDKYLCFNDDIQGALGPSKPTAATTTAKSFDAAHVYRTHKHHTCKEREPPRFACC